MYAHARLGTASENTRTVPLNTDRRNGHTLKDANAALG